MLTETTVNKLNEMKLTTMAKAFKAQLSDASIQNLSFEDRFGLLVDEEWTSRKNNHLKRLIHQARFSEPMACVEDIEYHSDRKLRLHFGTSQRTFARCNGLRKNICRLCVGYGCGAKVFERQIRSVAGFVERSCYCAQQRHIQKGDPTVQETGAADSG